MNNPIDWCIPPSVIRWMNEIPDDRPVAVLMRHSVRPPLPDGPAGYSLPITSEGERLAQELGGMIGNRLRTLHTSPLKRCIQTADALQHGAQQVLQVRLDRLLGDPGVYVIDGKQAGDLWKQVGHEQMMNYMVSTDVALPGMAAPEPAARFLVQHMLATAGEQSGLHVFITHDSLVTTTTARLINKPLGPQDWPWYLEAAFFWRSVNGVECAYREHRGTANRYPLCDYTSQDVIEFAKREIAGVLGQNCPARFFLAGGAFKSLLTGRSPRDLDLWAASERDREILVATLMKRGAYRMNDRPFTDAFEIGERIIELSHKVIPGTLEGRLARFDIALSAVGIEHHSGGGQWSVIIHRLAQTSVKRKEVLLLKPLVNWKFALATLERMRRYSAELDFTIPPEEESEIWRVFDEQPPEMQVVMLDRFAQTGFGGFNVANEAWHRQA